MLPTNIDGRLFACQRMAALLSMTINLPFKSIPSGPVCGRPAGPLSVQTAQRLSTRTAVLIASTKELIAPLCETCGWIISLQLFLHNPPQLSFANHFTMCLRGRPQVGRAMLPTSCFQRCWWWWRVFLATVDALFPPSVQQTIVLSSISIPLRCRSSRRLSAPIKSDAKNVSLNNLHKSSDGWLVAEDATGSNETVFQPEVPLFSSFLCNVVLVPGFFSFLLLLLCFI